MTNDTPFHIGQDAWYDTRSPAEYHFVANCPKLLEILPGDRIESNWLVMSQTRLPSCTQCHDLQIAHDLRILLDDIENAEGFDALQPHEQAKAKSLVRRIAEGSDSDQRAYRMVARHISKLEMFGRLAKFAKDIFGMFNEGSST